MHQTALTGFLRGRKNWRILERISSLRPQDAVVNFANFREVLPDTIEKLVRRAARPRRLDPAPPRQTLQRVLARWQRVPLQTVAELQPVLDLAQKLIGRGQPEEIPRAQMALVVESLQRHERR